MTTRERKIEELRPYPKNAKIHSDTQIANVAQSIKENGWAQPIAVDRDGVIIIGHCRYEAAKLLGLDTVPVVVMDKLTPEQVRKLRILDNKTNECPWDFTVLAEDAAGLDFSEYDLDINLDPPPDIDGFFGEAEQKEKTKKMITCPFCGESFEA